MINPEQLWGHWKLHSYKQQSADGSWQDALGADPVGCISYWPNGHMQVLIGSADRPKFRGEWSSISSVDKALCLDRMIAYSGQYSLQNNKIIHHVEVCWIPNWQGRNMVRLASFPNPHQLLLKTEPPVNDRSLPSQEVLWSRAADVAIR